MDVTFQALDMCLSFRISTEVTELSRNQGEDLLKNAFDVQVVWTISLILVVLQLSYKF